MRVSTQTLLSIFEWAQIMGISPWEFAQFGSGFPDDYENSGRGCNAVWYQFPWQQDALSREEIAQSILSAENALAQLLGYWPAPKYIEQSVISPEPRDSRTPFISYTYGNRRPYTLDLDWKYVLGGGSLNRTLIQADATINYADTDGDGVTDSFTVTVPTDILDPKEIALYIKAADRLGNPIDETWRIRPTWAEFSGGNVTVHGHAALMVPPAKEVGVGVDSLSVTDTANFMETIDVYRVFMDTTATDESSMQGYALWNGAPCSDLPEYTQPTRAIHLVERMNVAGQVSIVYAGDCCYNWRMPDRLFVRYLAGYASDVYGNMDAVMKDIVAKLATAWLPSDKCGCNRTHQILSWWRGMGNSDEADRKGRLVTFNEIDSPFGERRGAVHAWKRTWQMKALGHGVA